MTCSHVCFAAIGPAMLLAATVLVKGVIKGVVSFHLAGAYTFQITITKTYNAANLFEDLKALYKIAGVKGQHVAFIFTCAYQQPPLSSMQAIFLECGSYLPAASLCVAAQVGRLQR